MSGTRSRSLESLQLMSILLGDRGLEELMQEATPDLGQSGPMGLRHRRPKGWDIPGRIESKSGCRGWGGTLRGDCRMEALRGVTDVVGTSRPTPTRPTRSR